MRRMSLSLIAVLIFLSLAVPSVAQATDSTDILVGLKTLPILANKISGAANLAVVYHPAVAASRSDAEAIKAVIDGMGDAPGGAKLTAVLVGTDELSKLSSAKIAFLASGIPLTDFDSVATAANSANVLTISADLSCVRSNKCVLGVVSKPNVEIYFSKTAANNAKVGFVPAFIMLAKHI